MYDSAYVLGGNVFNVRFANSVNFSVVFALLVSVSACSFIAGEDPAITQIKTFIKQQAVDKTQSDWKTSLNRPPKLTFTSSQDYFWLLKTNQGDMKIKFMPDVAPMHVSSSIYLTTLGFYDDVLFHRVIPGFMAQGGDPLGKGTGGPGYYYAGEFTDDAKHDAIGTLSMANRGPDTDGSQFFITFKPTPFLDGRHTVFGKLVTGEDTLNKIAELGSRSGQTQSPVIILKAEILVEDKIEGKA